MPYYLSRSSIKFQGHAGQKIANFYQSWAFPDCNSSLNLPMDLKWCTKFDVTVSIEEAPYCFSRSFIKFQGHTGWLIDDFNPIFTRPVAAIKSFRFALWWYCLKKWQIAITYDGESMMTDNHLNMKEILKLLIFNYIISDYSWSYGGHSISTFIYLFIYLLIYLFINLFIVWYITSVQFLCVQ